MIKHNMFFFIIAINIILNSGCASYVRQEFQPTDIVISSKFDLHIQSILVKPSIKQSDGLVRSITDIDSSKIDKDNRMLNLARYQPVVYTTWKTDLENVFNDNKVFNSGSKNRYSLLVSVLDMHMIFPYDYMCYSKVVAQYEIINTSTSEVMFSKVIESNAEAKVHYFAGFYRMRDSFDRAINKNIVNFFAELTI